MGDPLAPGPAGLEAAVAKMFAPGASFTDQALPPEDPYANLDPVVLLKRFEEAKKDGQELRWVFERQWWRNLLYVLGRQWIYFDGKRNQWRDKRLKKWVPKPVTNKMREVVQAIRAMFSAVKLGTIARPNGGDPKNIATANTADGLQPLIHEEHEMDRVFRDADFWLIVCGNVFLYSWWNNDEKFGTVPVTHDECLTCGATVAPEEMETGAFVCPHCGGMDYSPVVVDEVPVGKGETDSVSPFEILLPSMANDFRDVRRVIRMRWRMRAYVEEKYPELATKIQWQKTPSERSLSLFKSIASQNDLQNTSFFMGASSTTTSSEGITEYEYWEQPSAQFPKGLFFRVLGDDAPIVVEDPRESTPGPIPTQTNKGDALWPWNHIGYEPVGGRLWASGALDPLIQKQDALNQLDSLMQLIVQRMANPIWLEPKGAEVEKFTGEPGLVVKYNMVGTSGQGKPERIDGTGPHASLFTIRDQYLRDIEEMAGTFDVIKGQKPTGVEAFSALQLLVERSQSRFTTAFNERGEAYRRWYTIALELERAYGPTDRSLAMLGPNRSWSFRHFQNANLQGSVSIVVEDGSNVPKTALGKRAAIEQANTLALINPQDPDQQYAILSQFGLSELIPSLDASVKACHREHDAFERWVNEGMLDQPPLTVRPWDGGLNGEGFIVRINELRKWANSDRMQEIMQTKPMAADVLAQYYTTLMQMLGMFAPPAGPSGPGGQGAPGLGGAMANSNQESGSAGNVPNNAGTDSAAPPM
jgi:hypothetical protein